MLTSPEKNVKFTDLDKQRIQKVSDRVDNLVKEIDSQSKTLNNILSENRKEENKNEYLVLLNSDLTKKQALLFSKEADIEASLIIKRKELHDAEERIRVIDQYLYKKENELKDKESTLTQLEGNHAKRVSDFERESKALEDKKASVEKAKTTLREAIDKIQW